uniref:Uncharacterized protein n=1 Tax=Picea glauca TaxID=3330 RepID=A0A101M133_PICGL|nr:hypothetical protein ABT39_MTgene4397 [Picea glauca]
MLPRPRVLLRMAWNSFIYPWTYLWTGNMSSSHSGVLATNSDGSKPGSRFRSGYGSRSKSVVGSYVSGPAYGYAMGYSSRSLTGTSPAGRGSRSFT